MDREYHWSHHRPVDAGNAAGEEMALVLPAPLGPTAAALRTGRLVVAEYVEHVRSHLERVDPLVRAFLDEADRSGRLRREVEALAERHPAPASRPPLYGIPVGVKDLFRVDSLPTRAGSDLPPELFAGPEASAIGRLRAAGALVLGKTEMDEFAYAEPAPTRNPHNLDHTPGGSSSGSAAAVAAGICPLALGSQTSRSVIGPAAFCGVVGFKPTFGRIPTDGMIPLAPSFDTLGLFAQDVAGMATAAAALIPDWTAATRATPPILGVPDGKLLTWTLPEGRRAFEDHVALLVQAGYDVRRIPFLSDAQIEEMDGRAMTLLHGEMARVHADWFGRYAERYRPRTARGVRRGQAVTDDELAACRAHRRVFRERVASLMNEAGIDLWITPASAGPAPVGLELTGWGGMTTAWSYAGFPCVSVPAGRADNGLPLGLQCVAAVSRDEPLLTWARGIEAVFAGVESS